MSARTIGGVWVLLAGFSAAAAAQSGSEPAAPRPAAQRGTAAPPAAEKPVDLDHLPRPLDALTCNIRQIEASGHLRVTAAQFDTLTALGEEGIAWTVEVIKPMTCRHFIREVERFRDVRFIADNGITRLEVHSTLLTYPDRVDQGAVIGQVLSRSEQLELAIYLSPLEVRELQGNRATQVLMSRIPQR